MSPIYNPPSFINPIFSGTIGIAAGSKFYPTADSTTAFQFTKADKTTVVIDVDTTNTKFGFGITPPSAYFHLKTTVAKGTPGVDFFRVDASNFDKVFNIDASGNFVCVGTFAAGAGHFGPHTGDNVGAVAFDNGGISSAGRALWYNGTGAAFNVIIDGTGIVKTTPLTVATLPAAATAGSGARAFVSDANAPAFGANVVGGGAVAIPVYSDGANWKVG